MVIAIETAKAAETVQRVPVAGASGRNESTDG